MRNLILIAEESDIIGEKKLIAQHLKGEMAVTAGLSDGRTAHQWRMADGSVWDIIVTGVGALNVLQALRDVPRDTRLLNIGYAGSANFDIGSTVEVSEVRLNHPNVKYPEPILALEPMQKAWLCHPAAVKRAICYSNTDFMMQSDYHNCVFDMELAYIAGMGFEHVSALKIVSDNLSLHAYREVATGMK